jgi:hypothetical protein
MLASTLALSASAMPFGSSGGAITPIGGLGGVGGGITGGIGGGSSCQILRSNACAASPSLPQSFEDSYDNSNIDPDRCARRAKEYADWCQDPTGATTTAIFSENGIEERVETYTVPYHPPPPTLGPVTGVVRAYQHVTGEHFYTVSAAEAVGAGFSIEANPYFYVAQYDSAGVGLVPFYRCFGSWGKHFYTQSATCENAPAHNEGALGLVANGPAFGAVPLYRLFNPGNGDHFYTVNAGEMNSAAAQGWHVEGVAAYVWLHP